jgi:hypothetical protein
MLRWPLRSLTLAASSICSSNKVSSNHAFASLLLYSCRCLVEFANVIVINKADLISELELRNLKSLLSSLNPAAHVLSTTFGEVPLKAILNTGLFDFNRASQAPGWLQELRGTHKPETLEFGISSFVFEVSLTVPCNGNILIPCPR